MAGLRAQADAHSQVMTALIKVKSTGA